VLKETHISEHPIGYKFHHSDQRNLCGLFVWTVIGWGGVWTHLLHIVSVPLHYQHCRESLKAHRLLMVTVYWYYWCSLHWFGTLDWSQGYECVWK